MAPRDNRDHLESAEMELRHSDEEAQVTEEARDDGDVKTIESECQVPVIQRTQSQITKQQQVHGVVDQLAGRSELIDNLQNMCSMLREEGFLDQHDPHAALVKLSEAQKQARNLGEDLMEDMLLLDSLSNLTSEDRTARKRAISEIEALLSSLDVAKVELLNFRKEVEAKVSEKMPDEKQSMDGVSEGASPNSLSRSGIIEEQKIPERLVKKAHVMTQEPPKTDRSYMTKQNLFTLPPLPGRKLWEQMELPVEFRAHEQRLRYVLEANVPDLDMKDIQLQWSSDNSRLLIEGVRLPSPAQMSKMQRRVASELEQFAHQSPQRFAVLGGAPALSNEVFMQVGQGYFGRFSKSFSVPDDVVVANIEASYDNGKLTVVLPKRKSALAQTMPSPYCHGMANPFHHMGIPRHSAANPFHRMGMPAF